VTLTFFDILAIVLQGNTLALFLFILCLDYVLRTSVNIQKQLASSVLFWSPKHGRRSVDRPLRVYTDQLVNDTGLRRAWESKDCFKFSLYQRIITVFLSYAVV